MLKLAAVTGLAIVGPAAPWRRNPSAPIEISSFSGAYLAARVAEVDNDLDGAIAYYKQALAFDPENQPLQQSLMLALISQGRFDESLPYAEKLKTVRRNRALLPRWRSPSMRSARRTTRPPKTGSSSRSNPISTALIAEGR